jgi:hypothetical protein
MTKAIPVGDLHSILDAIPIPSQPIDRGGLDDLILYSDIGGRLMILDPENGRQKTLAQENFTINAFVPWKSGIVYGGLFMNRSEMHEIKVLYPFSNRKRVLRRWNKAISGMTVYPRLSDGFHPNRTVVYSAHHNDDSQVLRSFIPYTDFSEEQNVGLPVTGVSASDHLYYVTVDQQSSKSYIRKYQDSRILVAEDNFVRCIAATKEWLYYTVAPYNSLLSVNRLRMLDLESNKVMMDRKINEWISAIVPFNDNVLVASKPTDSDNKWSLRLYEPDGHRENIYGGTGDIHNFTLISRKMFGGLL